MPIPRFGSNQELQRNRGQLSTFKVLSWSAHCSQETVLYQFVKNSLDLGFINQAISYYSKMPLVVSAPAGSQVKLVGMAMVYSLRDSTRQLEALWHETAPGSICYSYPTYKGKHVSMALMDEYARSGKTVNFKSLPPNLEATAQDVEALNEAISPLLPSDWVVQSICPKSWRWELPADGNLIANKTMWKVKTSSGYCPLNLNLIVQAVGYVLMDFEEIENVSFLFPRQQVICTFPLNQLLSKDRKDATNGFLKTLNKFCK